MDAKKYLSEYSKEFKFFKDKYFQNKIKEASKIDKIAAESIKVLSEYMEGGKHARGALVLLGYKIAGGQNLKSVFPASFAVELIHNSLLIHDDFVDNDKLRRGKKTVHEIFKDKRNNSHYGASMAIMIADLGIFWAHQILSGTKAIFEFDQLLVNTGYGELLDIDFDYKENITWEDIMKVRIYKTAHYTFVMPLQIGAILAGGKDNLLQNFKNYGEPVGLAFQIQDDILGIFGDSNETGKSNDSDIREGKKTLLYFKALELANKKEKEFLKTHYGKTTNNKEISEIRKILKNSRALDFSQKTALDFVEKGKKYIPKITKDKDLQDTLSSLADYIVQREK